MYHSLIARTVVGGIQTACCRLKAGYPALVLQFADFGLGAVPINQISAVSLQSGVQSRSYHFGRIHIALPMMPADDPVLAVEVSPAQYRVLVGRIERRQHKRHCVGPGGMSGRIAPAVSHFFIITGCQAGLTEPDVRPGPAIIVLQNTGGVLFCSMEYTIHQPVGLRGDGIRDCHTERRVKDAERIVKIRIRIETGLFAAGAAAHRLAAEILGLVIEKPGRAIGRRHRNEMQGIGRIPFRNEVRIRQFLGFGGNRTQSQNGKYERQFH